MKIEKRKVTESTKLSSIAKSAAASALGMAALFSLSACVESDPVSAYAPPKVNPSESSDSINSSDSNNAPDSPESSSPSEFNNSSESSSPSEFNNSSESSSSSAIIESSSSKQTPPSRSLFSSSSMLGGIAMTSSSRFYIPQTQTPLSSSATEAVKAISSSSAAKPQSSSEDIQPLAGDPIIIEEPESSSSSITERPDTLTVPNVHLCKDPCNHEIIIYSMVNTFEMKDVHV